MVNLVHLKRNRRRYFLEVGYSYATLEIKINYVRAITSDTGKVRAEGRVINSGKRIATAEERLFDSAGTLYAHGTTTCSS